MKRILRALGLFTIALSVWLRALRKLTVDFTAFWGLTGTLLAAAGFFPPLYGRAESLDAERKRRLCFFGGLLLSVVFSASLILSRLAVKNQELAVRLSLLGHEKEQMLARLDEINEEDSFCNQYDGPGRRGDGLSGVFEENR